MVQIIEMGRLPEEKEYKATCRHCGTKFSFKRGEAKLVNSADQRDPSYLKINCPLPGCGRPVEVQP